MSLPLDSTFAKICFQEYQDVQEGFLKAANLVNDHAFWGTCHSNIKHHCHDESDYNPEFHFDEKKYGKAKKRRAWKSCNHYNKGGKHRGDTKTRDAGTISQEKEELAQLEERQKKKYQAQLRRDEKNARAKKARTDALVKKAAEGLAKLNEKEQGQINEVGKDPYYLSREPTRW